MDVKLYIILTLLCSSCIYCKEDCTNKQKHIFEIKDAVELSFSAEIKELVGLVIDVSYKNRTNDRISLSSKTSMKYMHNGKKYINTELSSLINEGWHDIDLYVGTNILNIISKSSKMSPLTISSHLGMQSITVSAAKLRICEESCSIETSIKKNIENQENFKITAFTNSKYPISFEMSNLFEGRPIVHFEVKPRDCVYKGEQDSERVPCNHIIHGWNKLNIFANRTSLLINENIIPVDVSMKTITITGSYLVNCTKGNPKWKISKEEITVPISFGQENIFILTSTLEFSPVFNVDGLPLNLKWNNGLRIGSPGDPLQPKHYYIAFKTTSDMLIIYNKETDDILMELKTDKVPELIRVSSRKGEYQLTLSVEDSPYQPTHQVHATEPSIVTKKYLGSIKTDSPSSATLVVIIVSVIISVLGIVVIIVISIVIIRRKETIKKTIPKDVKEEYISIPNADQYDTSKEEAKIYVGYNIQASYKTEQEQKKIDQEKEEALDIRLKHFGNNKSVIQVFEELEHVIESIFKAIENKQLYGANSADALLRLHGLPGTLRDNQGNSLLHYLIFPIQQDIHIQGLNADDIKKFLSDHKVFFNAKNYKGETPLHALVLEASKGYFKEEWTLMAQLLIEIGCDPRIQDNNGQLPEDIALHRGCIYLQSLLRMSRIRKGEIIMKLKIDQWPKLIKGTYENNIEVVRQLLLENVPILPLSSTTDPLRVAIQKGNIELAMLLLSAGAPLCGRSLFGLNPLEVSNSIPALAVILPALIRREFFNCLMTESKMFIDKDSDFIQLRKAVIDLSEKVRKDGYKAANWNFSSESSNISERSREARKMLRLAASIGMGLTCQMLGLEDTFLNPLPLEISPDTDAKPNSLLILCRDLELSLSLREGNIPYQLKEEYEGYNFQRLQDFCSKRSINFNSLYDMQTPINKDVLKYIAEQGLDITYKILSKARNGQLVDLIVDTVTGFTMLHSAAYNGRMGMVEYLLLNNANERIKTEKGFTAAHVAAMRGHKECMEYILEFSKLSQSLINDKTNSGLTAHQISDGYSSEIKNVATFLLHESVSHSILSEPVFQDKVKSVLNDKKISIKNCLNNESIDHIIPSGYVKENNEIWQQLKEESEYFIQKLINTNSRLDGKIISHYRNIDALELLLMDSYQVYLEINDCEYWQDKNMHKAFMESGYKALNGYTVKSKNLCLVPKVFEPTVLGANIFLSYCSHQITTRISIHVIPVLKEKLEFKSEELKLSQIFGDTIAQTSVIHKAKTKSEKWSYVTGEIEKQLFSKLDVNKLLVLSICRYIKKILNPHWWFPRVESRRHGRQWHHYAVSLPSVSERLLISCFLWEAFKTPEEKWDKSNILNRVLGVFRQMAKKDEDGKMVAKCFLDPGKEDIRVSPNILLIIEFLQELMK